MRHKIRYTHIKHGGQGDLVPMPKVSAVSPFMNTPLPQTPAVTLSLKTQCKTFNYPSTRYELKKQMEDAWTAASQEYYENYQTRDDQLQVGLWTRTLKLPNTLTTPSELTKYIIVQRDQVIKLWLNQNPDRFKLDVVVASYYERINLGAPLISYGDVSINGLQFYYMISEKLPVTGRGYDLRKLYPMEHDIYVTQMNRREGNFLNPPVSLNDGENQGVDHCGNWLTYDTDSYILRGDLLSSKEKKLGKKYSRIYVSDNPKKDVAYYTFEQALNRIIV